MRGERIKLGNVEKLRLLSDRERSKVYLARMGGGIQVLKVEQPREGVVLEEVLERYGSLRELSRSPGLLPILEYGLTEEGWVWQTSPVGDNLPGRPGLGTAEGVERYSPMNLRTRTREMGPAGAREVAGWGMRLCGALGVLPGAGWVHRDVKPTNIVFVGGEVMLGDYGLVGKPGTRLDFVGTEGFLPLEGSNDSRTDLYGLGRTLYEAWTGMDRLEFPSLPKGVLESVEWAGHGAVLNEVILKSNSARKGERYGSAEAFGEALLEVEAGRRGVSRRVWVKAAVAAGVAGGCGLVILKGKTAGPILKWETTHSPGFASEAWLTNAWSVDWDKRRILSMGYATGKVVCQWVDIDTLRRTGIDFPVAASKVTVLARDPERGTLLGADGCKGDVYEWNPAEPRLERLGGGPCSGMNYQAASYWNKVTKRVGIFGGLGIASVRNDRWEFDIGKREWVEMEPNDLKKPIWPRGMKDRFSPDPEEPRIYLMAGAGSPLGVLGKEVPGLGGFDGRFYDLDDIWSLDLESGAWRELLPRGRLGVERAAVLFRHPVMRALVVRLREDMHARKPDPARGFLLELDRPGRLRELRMEGATPGLMQIHGQGLDPKDGKYVLLTEEAAYRISL